MIVEANLPYQRSNVSTIHFARANKITSSQRPERATLACGRRTIINPAVWDGARQRFPSDTTVVTLDRDIYYPPTIIYNHTVHTNFVNTLLYSNEFRGLASVQLVSRMLSCTLPVLVCGNGRFRNSVYCDHPFPLLRYCYTPD